MNKGSVLTDMYYNTDEPAPRDFKQELDFKIPFFFWIRLETILENAGKLWDAWCKEYRGLAKTLEEFKTLTKVERQ